MGTEKFLAARPYLLYFGKGRQEDGSPHQLLLIPESNCRHPDVIKKIRELAPPSMEQTARKKALLM
jgi:hypothetical protein